MNACRDVFGGRHGGVHIGCYFNWKQAIRKYMISTIGFDTEMVSRFMKDIEILTIIPIEDIETFGIPYLRELYEGGITEHLEMEIEMWADFWRYFVRQWLNYIPPSSWSVYDARMK